MQTWWQEKTVYQIYPMSFCDSNGDGVGDIPGIISKLPYLKSLGVGLLWLSPVYRSPGEDNGYDISDYTDIDPKFGTLRDMDRLIAEAKKLGLGIVMDLVINHTSKEHEWFQKSRRREAPYTDFYYWRDGRGKRPPNNWTGFFGGSCWTFDTVRGQYYLHLFAKGQPDLNYHTPAVIEAVEKVMDFWLARGVAGFRCDVITLLWKDSLKNGFPKYILTGSERYMNRPGCHALLQRFYRDVLSKYDCFTVGETVLISPREAQKLTNREQPELSMAFTFDHLGADNFFIKWFPRKFALRRFFKSLEKWQKALSWNALVLENHDQARSVSRFGDESPESAKAMLTLLLTLRGTPFIYQGEELGMTNARFASMADIQDVESHNIDGILQKLGVSEKKRFRLMQIASRDNARTPMQWSDEPNAGFTTGTPWLKVNENYTRINARMEEQDPNSVLHWCKALLAYRNASQILKEGTCRFTVKEKRWCKIERRLGRDRLYVIINWSNTPLRLPLLGKPALSTHGTKTLNHLLQPWEAVIIEDFESKEEEP
ncbi:MAG: alpha-glucosidase [Clostridia bacterium]|nr:alpha-glucosidase [Clostridia bacterium]